MRRIKSGLSSRLGIAPVASWADWLSRNVGDGPIKWLPPCYQKEARPHWRACVTWVGDAPYLITWGAFAVGLYRPPERLMTEAEIAALNFAKMAISVHANDPKYIRLVDRWHRAWGLAQLAADARVRARSNQERP